MPMLKRLAAALTAAWLCLVAPACADPAANFALLPLIQATATTSQDGDGQWQIAFATGSTPTPIDLTGITFALQWHPANGNTPNATIVSLSAGQYLTNGGPTGVLSLTIPRDRLRVLPVGTYAADLVATLGTGAGVPTSTLGTISITHGALGSSSVTSLTATARNAASGTTIGYIPGPPGPTGPVGPVGPQGAAGGTGATGSQGPTGPAGPANSLSIGAVTTGAAGSSASATVTGTAPSQTLNLAIPQGAQGVAGTNGTNGAAGTNGNTLLNGSGAPVSGTGNNGDFYVDPAAQLIYGPKASGAWPSGVSYKGQTGATGSQGAAGTNGTNGATGAAGTNGAAWYSGTSAPGSGTGITGDWYINTATGDLYTKGSGGWGSPAINITAVSGAVHYDTSQSLTAAQKTQALTNLGAPYVTASSIGQNGYMKWSDGHIEQWGQVAGGNGSTDPTVTFPVTCPTAVWSVTATIISTTSNGLAGSYAFVAAADNVATSGFTVRARYVNNGGTVAGTTYGAAWRAVCN